MAKTKKAAKPVSKQSVWQGPVEDGITFSLLSRFLECRERFRLLVVEGLRPTPEFNHRIEYGQMWHICEEALASAGEAWDLHLMDYAKQLRQRYPLQQQQIQHWYNVCKTQFPLYWEYWQRHKDRVEACLVKRKLLLREQVFDVPYLLPSGRQVRLRGKWDGVDVVGSKKRQALYLLEHKTRGDIRENQLGRQLLFDMQTMIYLVALQAELLLEKQDGFPKPPLRGVYYNVVRRPLSGGKGSIRQHKPTKSNPQGEMPSEFYARLGGLIEAEPEYYFMRWQIEVTEADIIRFKHDFLTPILEQLCDWWEWINSPIGRKNPFADHLHWRTPYGFYNVLAEGGSAELDEYLATGSELGLTRTDNLFPELG